MDPHDMSKRQLRRRARKLGLRRGATAEQVSNELLARFDADVEQILKRKGYDRDS